MEQVTTHSRAGEIEALKPYSKYLCYQAGFEKPVIEYTLEELQDFIPSWNAKAEAAGLQRAAELAEKQEILFGVYREEECADDPQKKPAIIMISKSFLPNGCMTWR